MIRQFYERVRNCVDDCSFQQHRVTYAIAGRTLHLHYASAPLFGQLHRAISHQQINYIKGDLTLYVWDSASTGVPMVPSPFPNNAFGSRQSVNSAGDKRVWDKCAEDETISVSYDVGSGVLSLINFERNEAIWWCADSRLLPAYERAAPFRTIFQQWFANHGSQFIHTAAIGNEQGAVLLAGVGGSGKSTTAIHCLLAGMRFVGEDYCLVDANAGVHAVYNSVKLTARSIAQLPTLVVPTEAGDGGKTIHWLYPTYPIADDLPIRAILLPKVTAQEQTTVEKTTAGAALRALAPTTIFQLAASGKAAFQRMARLAAAVPVCDLYIGRDPASITTTIRAILMEATCS